MDLWKFIKASMMILLVGSSFLFSSPLVQKAADTMDRNPNKELGINSEIEKQDILFWTYLLSVLGASVYLLVRILAAMSELQWDKFSDHVLTSSRTWHLG